MTTASWCRSTRTRIRCHAGINSRAVSMMHAAPTTEWRIFSRGFPDERRRDGRLFLQWPLQFPHERRQTGTTFALEPLGLQDRLHLGEGFIDIVIDHDVIVLRPMAQVVRRAAPPGARGPP